MSDLICPKCGEMWESYGITYAKGEGDLTLAEVKKFLRGEGCPACDFGTTCPRCEGAGIEQNQCPTCLRRGYVFVRRCETASDTRFHRWFFGYEGHADFPLRFLEEVKILTCVSPQGSCEGDVQVAKVVCPDCHAKGEPCRECGGDGKYHAGKHGDYTETAMHALLDGSDEEPIGLITDFLAGAEQRAK